MEQPKLFHQTQTLPQFQTLPGFPVDPRIQRYYSRLFKKVFKKPRITWEYFEIHVSYVYHLLKCQPIFLQRWGYEDLKDIARNIVVDVYSENQNLRQIQLSLLKRIVSRHLSKYFEIAFNEGAFNEDFDKGGEQ